MRNILLTIILVGAGCDSGSGSGADLSVPAPDLSAIPAPFGLDTRPANPGCVAQPRPPSTAGLALATAFNGLTFSLPVLVSQAPGDSSRWFVVEKGGAVKTFPDANPTAATTFIDISARVDAANNESGLLGMAFHPSFATNHQVFLSYDTPDNTSPAGFHSVISRFVSNDGGATLDQASEQVLLTIAQPFTNHNGGNIVFGPDGYLYAGFGDGGSGGDPMKNGQNVN